MSSQDPLALTQAYVRTTSRRPQPRVLAFATERDYRIPRGISACMIQKDAEIDDRSHHPERKIPADILQGWAKRVANERGYGSVSQLSDEGPLISNEGLLQIEWPRRIADGAAVDLDLLLVTANDPTLTGNPLSYPSVTTVVNAWNDASQEYADYYWKYNDHGITTIQDQACAGSRYARWDIPVALAPSVSAQFMISQRSYEMPPPQNGGLSTAILRASRALLRRA